MQYTFICKSSLSEDVLLLEVFVITAALPVTSVRGASENPYPILLSNLQRCNKKMVPAP